MYRTHTCGELRAVHTGQSVTLAGWVQTVRKFGSITFIDLRDRYGITQLLFGEDLNKELAENPLGREFVLQVKGSSMIEDHIMDGDFVVCEQTQVANPGDIVVALVGGDEATLKRFYREGPGKIRLQPANSEMAPIIVPANDVKIQGRVIGVLRKY